MKEGHRRWVIWLLGLLSALAAAWPSGQALAHSSSNSYLSLSAPEGKLVLRADVHWRDVDLMLDLDDDRDGRITWGEAQSRAADLQSWLTQGLALSESGQACTLGAADLKASERADGSYLSALWTVQCPSLRDLPSARIELRYSLMFAQDQLHRGLLKVELPGVQSSAILSPERPSVQLSQAEGSALRVFGRSLLEGI
ncbi:MAG: hypothetical protein WCK08_20275, partial [Betaproteobacteria bacterium]